MSSSSSSSAAASSSGRGSWTPCCPARKLPDHTSNATSCPQPVWWPTECRHVRYAYPGPTCACTWCSSCVWAPASSCPSSVPGRHRYDNRLIGASLSAVISALIWSRSCKASSGRLHTTSRAWPLTSHASMTSSPAHLYRTDLVLCNDSLLHSDSCRTPTRDFCPFRLHMSLLPAQILPVVFSMSDPSLLPLYACYNASVDISHGAPF